MTDYDRIARVIEYLDDHYLEQPDLQTLARQVKLSPHHFHRLFCRWAGITPKDFLQCLTLSHARRMLLDGRSVLETALDAGLSGPGRLHDLCVSLEAASPGELKSGGADWTIKAGFAESPFGACLVGTGPRGICHLSFVESTNRRRALATINCDWPHARVQWDDDDAALQISPLFETPVEHRSRPPLRAFVRGTPFQVRVWRALLQVPRGRVVSYGRLAEKVCTPAARAVGSAVAANPLAYLIPCHRVIRATGVVGEYRWGRTRKKAILAWENSM